VEDRAVDVLLVMSTGQNTGPARGNLASGTGAGYRIAYAQQKWNSERGIAAAPRSLQVQEQCNVTA
jgi:hypothetical protein